MAHFEPVRFPGAHVGANWHTPPPVPQALHDIKAEADAYLAEHPQFYTTDSGIVRELRKGDSPKPYEIAYHHFNIDIEGDLMNTKYAECEQNTSYGGPPLSPSPELQAKAHRKQAAQIEATAKAQRKAAKKAKRRERQRQDDIVTALDTLVEVANSGDAQARVVAANSILAHYTNEY